MRLNCDPAGLLYLVGAGLVVAFDQLTKQFAVDRLGLGEVYAFMPGLNLTLVLNRVLHLDFLPIQGAGSNGFLSRWESLSVFG